MVEQTKKNKVGLIDTYIMANGQDINVALLEESNLSGKYKNTWVNSRQAVVKTLLENNIKMYRWLLDDLSISVPDAYTDAEVDIINPEIRTLDE